MPGISATSGRRTARPGTDLRAAGRRPHIVREGLRRIPEATAGYRVVEASSGHQALECLQREPVRLAIVDLSMPG